MAFHIYILKSFKDGSLYVGSTQNLANRLKQHNNPNKKTYTAKRGPWKLVYSERHTTRAQAVQRERFLKSHAGSHEHKLLASKGG